MIKSVSYDQGEILRNILELYVPDRRVDLDCTYSSGNFYRGTGVPEPPLRFDTEPRDGALYGDARRLPLGDGTVGCMVFDPPFLATTGSSLAAGTGNRINRRFGVYPSERELFQFYRDALREACRVLKNGGILIFKCQDKVSGGKQYMSHCFVYNEAVRAGFYPKDLFVLLAKNRLVANWQKKNQRHARKYHSYFWVFEKSDREEPIVQCLTRDPEGE